MLNCKEMVKYYGQFFRFISSKNPYNVQFSCQCCVDIKKLFDAHLVLSNSETKVSIAL